MTYREYIYKCCTDTDMSKEDEVVALVQLLAYECTLYHDLLAKYEDKLKETMTFKDFDRFASDVAKELFKAEIGGLDESELKDFILENFDELISDDEV